jgi:hypothetical protein
MYTKLLMHLEQSLKNYEQKRLQQAEKYKLPTQLDYNLNEAELRLADSQDL